MAISPMSRGLRGGLGKLAIVSGFALIFFMLVVPTFCFAGDTPPAAADSAAPPDPAPQAAAPMSCMASFAHQDYMLNWGPERQRWAEKGFTFNFFYITDALGTVSVRTGGEERFGNWQRIRGTVDYDFGKSTGAKGLSFHATGVWQNGVNMGAVIGSIANPSGIVSFHQFRLDSMWLRQSFHQGKVVVTAGLMASQDFYGLQEFGGSFLTEPLDYNYGNMGNVRASYDPSTGPGAEFKVVPTKRFYAKTAWFMPSDDGEQHVYPTGFNYKNGYHGSTWDSEVGFFTDPAAGYPGGSPVAPPANRKSYPGIIKFGFIYNGSKAPTPIFLPAQGVSVSPSGGPSGIGGFPDYSNIIVSPVTGSIFGPNRVNGNYTFYLQVDQPVFRVSPGSNRGIDATFGFNIGPQNKSEVPTEFTGGVIFNGPIPHRAQDGLAFGFVYSKIGNDFNRFQNLLGLPSLNNEFLFEMNYKMQVFPWFTLQPVYQLYNNVGGTNENASLAGFRLVTVF